MDKALINVQYISKSKENQPYGLQSSTATELVEAITDDVFLRLYTICIFSSFIFFFSHRKVNTSNHRFQ